MGLIITEEIDCKGDWRIQKMFRDIAWIREIRRSRPLDCLTLIRMRKADAAYVIPVYRISDQEETALSRLGYM